MSHFDSLIVPYAKYESFLELLRQSTLRFFSGCEIIITQFVYNLYTLYGVGSIYNDSIDLFKEKLVKPYCVVSLTESPKVSEERHNATLHNARTMIASSLRSSPAYLKHPRVFFPILVGTDDRSSYISRIDQYMECSIEITIYCDSYEMAYTFKRFVEAFLVPNKRVAFRNLLVPYQISIEQAAMLPDELFTRIKEVSIKRVVLQTGRIVYTIPISTWLHVTMTDSRIDFEGVPYEGAAPVYKYTTAWGLFFHEPVMYQMFRWS